MLLSCPAVANEIRIWSVYVEVLGTTLEKNSAGTHLIDSVK
jgi:hypothetical protein